MDQAETYSKKGMVNIWPEQIEHVARQWGGIHIATATTRGFNSVVKASEGELEHHHIPLWRRAVGTRKSTDIYTDWKRIRDRAEQTKQTMQNYIDDGNKAGAKAYGISQLGKNYKKIIELVDGVKKSDRSDWRKWVGYR